VAICVVIAGPVRYSRLEIRNPNSVITIRLKQNGPYVIAAAQAGEVTIVDVDGNVLVPEAGRSIALCRCGSSSTKPFCDRSHRDNGFDGATRWTGCFEVANPDGAARTDSKPGETT
jgi:CDGSH-type Zn-finger protein